MALDLGLPPNPVKDLDEMVKSARDATDFLKAIAHEGRLIILCRLARGEASVTELENMLSARQAAVSQQLARLRIEGLVDTRRDGKTIYYSITDKKTREMVGVVYKLFCEPDD
jgi:DNA-binding transcriptional ArsR family regulator